MSPDNQRDAQNSTLDSGDQTHPGQNSSRSSNSSLALERLRKMLDEDHSTTDHQLPTERVLSEILGVGRRAVRRALEVLESEGRIWRRQGSGTYVGPAPEQQGPTIDGLSNRSNFFEVMEVRLRIEPALAQLAALRATEDDIKHLRELTTKIVEAKDADSRELWDSALHRYIAQTAGNTLFLALFNIVDKVRQDPAWHHVRELARSRDSAMLYSDQHDTIVEAIERRDPAGAEAAARQHILSLHERLLAVTAGGLSHAS
ncbi:FadR/GntR family transcriptional regulator [Pelagibius sp. Alg239-R121]|uniref:FadR/GntR family transcriptional regulator n=1 Tax=Pelagibius sp. Alg239-R121 TaxID=2993448 RepID=UPI0024A72DDA|nr:FCD domain-containing protein [Pelagibius sp. Alg239-R121]